VENKAIIKYKTHQIGKHEKEWELTGGDMEKGVHSDIAGG
jgi:hypothetical protein